MDVQTFIILSFTLCGLSRSQSIADSVTASSPSGCEQVIIKAEARTKYATTPGWPGAFPGDAKCTWAIYCEAGKRIRLEFQKFFLLGPINGKCEYHYVIVKSPFTHFSMGRYCGEMGLPTIVSTGNLIYVELHTLVTVTTDNYQGFKLAFKETLESSSYELRANNAIDDVIMTVDPDTMNVLSPTAPTTPAPRTTRSTTKPWRFVPSRRPLQNINNKRPIIRAPPQRAPSYVNNIQPPIQRTRIIKPSEKTSPPVKIEIIVGIAVGGVVAVAIIVMIALKMMSRKRSEEDRARKGDNKDSLSTTETAVTKNQQLPFPPMYPNSNQQYFYGANAYIVPPIDGMPMEMYPTRAINETNRSRRAKRVKRKRRQRR